MDTNSFIEQALKYLNEFNFSIIPVGRDKKPLVKWEEFQQRKATEQEVRKWAASFKSPNIGIVTGAISGIVAVDIESGGSTENLPSTVISRTGGGGYHFIYEHPKIEVKTKARIRDLTDIRGDGGYIVAPPSVHSSGKSYEWLVPPQGADFAKLPEWIVEAAVASDKAKVDWNQFIKTENSKGVRNMTAAQLAGKLLHHLPESLWEAGWLALKEWNTEQNKPPMEETELRSVWESILEREGATRSAAKIDSSTFKPLNSTDLAKILGLTIKRDEENKVATFLCLLSAYTKDSQFNISYNAPSSTGKSYIPIEIASLFPKEDVIMVGYTSPTAFFHDIGTFDTEKKGYIVNLEHKILIFLDQPHTLLLQHLRPLLSHDKKELHLKITDKSQKAGLRTKNIYVLGFPAVVFCTAGLKIDEQESTRFILLSPETSQEKLREGILEKIKREGDKELYISSLEENPARNLLKDRILAIKQEGVSNIKVGDLEEVRKVFFESHRVLKPRHQRDVGRFISLVKAFALLNVWFRDQDSTATLTNQTDLEEVLRIWGKLSESQEYNLPPYVFSLFKEVVLKIWDERSGDVKIGISREELLKEHLGVYGRNLSPETLRKEIVPLLEAAGLIIQEPDPVDKRHILIYPTPLSPISPNINNRGKDGGVDSFEASIRSLDTAKLEVAYETGKKWLDEHSDHPKLESAVKMLEAIEEELAKRNQEDEETGQKALDIFTSPL